VIGMTVGTLALIAGGVALAMQSASSAPRGTFTSGGPALAQVSAPAVPTQTIVLTLPKNGVAVSIPASAMKDTGSWALSALEPQTFAAPNDVWRRLQVVNIQFFNPKGDVVPDPPIAIPLQLCYTLDAPAWASVHAAPFQIQRYEAPEGHVRWTSVPLREDPAARQICADTPKVALYALAVPSPLANSKPTPAQPYSPP
jgi:hypothetical protein